MKILGIKKLCGLFEKVPIFKKKVSISDCVRKLQENFIKKLKSGI